jgi:hypothetical protein
MFKQFYNIVSLADAIQFIRLNIFWRLWRGSWVLGRHACLGNEVISLSGLKKPILNIQKGRIDFWLKCLKHPHMTTRTSKMAQFLCRSDMTPIFWQQEFCNRLPNHPPNFVYMDSLAELVDQLFINKMNGWGFCSYYSDIGHNKEFDENFENKGLLDIKQLEFNYREFFDLIRFRYGEVPIVFLHFPICLEKRERFAERGRIILSIIEKLSLEYTELYSISVDEIVVSKPITADVELRDFPYHYNKETYSTFSKAFNEVLIKINKV